MMVLKRLQDFDPTSQFGDFKIDLGKDHFIESTQDIVILVCLDISRETDLHSCHLIPAFLLKVKVDEIEAAKKLNIVLKEIHL